MDWLSFTAEIVKATAWPAALIVVFLVLRKQFVTLLPGLESLRWKDFEARFRRKVHEVSVEARAALSDPELAKLPPPPEEHELLRLAELSPRAAILEAWIALENAAANALRREDAPITSKEIRQPAKLVDALVESDLLTASQGGILRELRHLRNAAAHASDPKITVETAREFVQLAAAFERLLRSRTPAPT